MKIFIGLLACFLTACGPSLFRPERPSVHKLPNGATLLILEDHDLPTFQLEIFIRGGAVYDPKGKEGLASLAMQSLRTGGTAGTSPDEVNRSLEFVGASLEMGASQEYLSVSLATLSKHLDLGLELMTRLLREPDFDPGQFEIAKQRGREAIVRDREDPLTTAIRELPSLIYGPDSPWGRSPSLESLARIQREDLLDFHRRMISPDRMILAASGDFREEELVTEISALFEGWEPAKPLPKIQPLEKIFRPGLWIIPQKGLTQTTLALGHLGERRDNPDKFALVVMNDILGGSGSIASRLGQEVRSAAGKAYAIWSQYDFGQDYGLFKMLAQTAAPNTGWVARKMMEIDRQMSTAPSLNHQELRRSQRGILRSLIFDFETRFARTKAEARFTLWGYPENYLEIFQRRIAHLDAREVEGVAKKYLNPDGLTILAVGEEQLLRRELAGLGEIRIVPLK